MRRIPVQSSLHPSIKGSHFQAHMMAALERRLAWLFIGG
jgi:hypothetical protein